MSKSPERVWITHYVDGGVSAHWLDAPRKYDPERDPVKIASVEYIRADIASSSAAAQRAEQSVIVLYRLRKAGSRAITLNCYESRQSDSLPE